MWHPHGTSFPGSMKQHRIDLSGSGGGDDVTPSSFGAAWRFDNPEDYRVGGAGRINLVYDQVGGIDLAAATETTGPAEQSTDSAYFTFSSHYLSTADQSLMDVFDSGVFVVRNVFRPASLYGDVFFWSVGSSASTSAGLRIGGRGNLGLIQFNDGAGGVTEVVFDKDGNAAGSNVFGTADVYDLSVSFTGTTVSVTLDGNDILTNVPFDMSAALAAERMSMGSKWTASGTNNNMPVRIYDLEVFTSGFIFVDDGGGGSGEHS